MHTLTAAVALLALIARPASAAPDEGRVEAAARAYLGEGIGIGTLGAELEGLYMPSPHWGAGGLVSAFYVDNGADPYYSKNGTLDRGYHGLAFAEGDLFAGWVTPYARLGVGLGRYSHIEDGDTEPSLNFVAQASGGVALRGGPVVFRLSASPSLYGGDFLMVYGAALGARF